MNNLQKLNDEQKYHFLLSALDEDEFLKFLQAFENFDREYKVRFDVTFKLSEYEFQNIPFNYYREIYGRLNFNELDASNFKNWFYVNYEAVKNGIIKPYYFAFTEKYKDGLKNITRALREYENGEKKFFNNVFRAVLRRMFGFIKERGRKGIYQDVPFSIAWWKYHIYLNTQDYVKNEKIIEFLYENSSFYNYLIEKMGFTLTVLAERKLLASMLDYVSENENEIKSKKKFIQKLAAASSVRSFGALSVEDIKDVIKGM